MTLVGTVTGVTGAAGHRRDLTFKSPESLRPKTFLLDLKRTSECSLDTDRHRQSSRQTDRQSVSQ